tara:strand:- start:44 stop:913 length:870 start_codon:yes stop_codon:yes gene_type:complete
MAFNNHIIDIILQLKKVGFLKNIKSVIDMGDQDLNLKYKDLKKIINIEENKFDELFFRAKDFPERPRVSSSAFWQSLGIMNTSRIDLFQLSRKRDVPHNFYKVDLNFPLEDQAKIEPHDLSTDIGNNEHPFNVSETYKTMHKLTKKGGYLLIQQSMFRGNGLYSFEPGYFECLAAVNNYSILFSSFCISYKDKHFYMPLSKEMLNAIDLNNTGDLQLIYLFRKNADGEFIYPYQGIGQSPHYEEFYFSKILNQNFFPERNYIPQKIDNLSFKLLLKYIFYKIKSKFLKN